MINRIELHAEHYEMIVGQCDVVKWNFQCTHFDDAFRCAFDERNKQITSLEICIFIIGCNQIVYHLITLAVGDAQRVLSGSLNWCLTHLRRTPNSMHHFYCFKMNKRFRRRTRVLCYLPSCTQKAGPICDCCAIPFAVLRISYQYIYDGIMIAINKRDWF